MQNIDYSRRLRGSTGLTSGMQEPHTYTSYANPSLGGGESSKSKSAFVLLIGAILLFTSGMVVGIQLNQKEKGFQSNGEKSFSNVGKSTTQLSKNEGLSSKDAVEKEEERGTSYDSPFPSSLKFPPKNDQINYMVQVGDFSPEEAVQIGKQLMTKEPSLQGRIFRTSTGKLYAGYFYRMEDAKEALDKITSSVPGVSSEATVKTIRF
ncbi:hypothetical protein [Leptospira idonii]|uniref:SPOR domain-containing protein n=1 Tax=Leptospira idonii TaxID=1193500 RepID=A0A4R9M4K7_9LEPT|nr:hypothetical protein [Leptospira idonii]TGN21012.1 hypothetical protein EHS15_00385 [Leptospira idonii]